MYDTETTIFLKRLNKVIFYTIVIVFLIIALFPFIWGFITSIKPMSEVNNFTIPLSKLTFKNYFYILSTFPFGRWLFNSFFVAVCVTIGNILVNSLAGYALARIDFKGKKVFFWVILSLMMIPGQVTMVPMFILLVKLGWVNTYQGLIIPFLFSFFNIFLMRQFFMSVPKCLEEAAEIDGLSRLGTFFRIILPISKPALAAQFILTYVGNWNSFIWPNILARTSDMYTLPVGLNSFQLQYIQFWNQTLAGAILLTAPIIIVFIIFQRFFIEGISGSGIKG